MTDKIRALLGFSRKAGKLATGTETTRESVMRHRARLVLIASDISPKSVKEIRFICHKNNTRVEILPLTTEEISAAIGRRAGILALEDDGFAAAVVKNIL